MHRLILLGLNHTTAPLDVREKVAFDPQQRRAALGSFRERITASLPPDQRGAAGGDVELVMLSTCNRVELYSASRAGPAPDRESMVRFLAGCHGLNPSDLDAHVYAKVERDAVDHLFTVVASLDSMVLGETQIIGQVRGSYELACEVGTAGAVLNPLFQRAIAVGKDVLHRTALAEGRVSVASVAVSYARGIFETFHDKTLLSIGAGKMAMLVLRHFAELRPGRLLVSNRDEAKARVLAAEFGGSAAAFEMLDEHLVAADVVISSTGASRPILTRAQFERALKRRRYRPMFVIDIAVPRDVEAAVGELENVYLYNIDDLQQVVSGTREHRSAAVEAARAIVRQHVDEFLLWHRRRELGPAIDQLYKRYHAIALEEAGRTAHKLGEALDSEGREHLDELARRIVNKLLHDPVKALQNPDGQHLITPHYLHALGRLFGLHDPRSDSPDKDPAQSSREGGERGA